MEMILLDRVRDDIHEHKKLNVHLFNALKKALYKPAAWFKGFLFPLVESGCTLREAHIISAVLARVSIPVLHSGAALKGLCDIAALEASAGSEGGGGKNSFQPCPSMAKGWHDTVADQRQRPTSSSEHYWKRNTPFPTRSWTLSSSTL